MHFLSEIMANAWVTKALIRIVEQLTMKKDQFTLKLVVHFKIKRNPYEFYAAIRPLPGDIPLQISGSLSCAAHVDSGRNAARRDTSAVNPASG
ncbi:hypothetical protein D3C81_2157990 [compost metagenome]